MADHPSAGRWAVFADAVRTQLWPVPTAAVATAVLAGVALPRVDRRLDGRLSAHLFGGGAEAARSILTIIAGSMITVTALTFSLTVVTLQLASSQFSPRLLRTFTSDPVVRRTLALFLATFVYALTVLRTVRTPDQGRAEFVPPLAVSVAYLLTVASVLVLVAFLSHLAEQIRVETMMRVVHEEASRTIRALQSEDPTHPAPPAPEQAPVLLAPRSGFLTSVDEKALLDASTRHRVGLRIDRSPGASLIAGTPVGRFWSADQATVLTDDQCRDVQAAVDEALQTGFERTAAQDVGFGLRQLTDVAGKALSPGINDPTTAVHALGHSSALLCDLTKADLGTQVVCDEDDRPRVALSRPDFGELLDLAIAQPRRYGATHPAVLARLFRLLGEVAWVSDRPDHHAAVRLQLERLRGTVASQSFDHAEVAELDALAAVVDGALGGVPW